MKTIRNIMLVLLSLTAGIAAAKETCIKDMAEYQSKKASFPPTLQNTPIVLVADSRLVTAAVMIKGEGNKIKLEGHVWQPGDIYVDDSYVKKLCFDGTNFRVTLDNQKNYSVVVRGGAFKIKGISFKKSSMAGFASVANEINTEMASRKTTKKANGTR